MNKKNRLALKIKDDLKKNRMSRVMKMLEELTFDSPFEREGYHLIRYYHELKRKEIKGTISHENYNIDKSKLSDKILILLDEIQNSKIDIVEINYDEIKFSIGMDIGDGESSISFVPVNSHLLPEIYEGQDEEKSIITAFIEIDGDFFIGEQALSKAGIDEIIMNFKHPPSGNKWKSTKRNLLPFSEEFFEQFLKSFPLINRKNSVLYIGHPASWNPIDIRTYYEAFFDSQFPTYQIVSESKSALIHLRDIIDTDTENKKNISKSDLNGNILVIDIGSSTVDFTILENGSTRDIPFVGKEFGCRLIDKSICDWLIMNHKESKKWKSKLLNGNFEGNKQKSYLTYLCRKIKEAVFKNMKNRVISPPLDNSLIEIYKTFYPILKRITISKIMKLPVTETGLTWEQVFSELLINQVKSECPELQLVLLTGGGSRMEFVKQTCEKIFKVRIEYGDEPSFMVSKGLAGHGRWIYRVRMFRKEVAQIYDNELKVKINQYAKSFTEKFMNVLYEQMLDKVGKPFYKELKRGVIQTNQIDDMNQYFTNRFIDWLNSKEGIPYRKEITEEIETGINKWLEEKSSVLEEKYKIETGKLELKFNISSKIFTPGDDFLGKIEKLGSAVTAGVLRVLDNIIPQSVRDIVPDSIIDRTMNIQNLINKTFLIPGLRTVDRHSKGKLSKEGIEIMTNILFDEINKQLLAKADEAEKFIK